LQVVGHGKEKGIEVEGGEIITATMFNNIIKGFTFKQMEKIDAIIFSCCFLGNKFCQGFYSLFIFIFQTRKFIRSEHGME